ncbi:hypothetical protein GE115_07260 [Agromyces sp. CFH 90414]|uniref:DUF998 domain-containing protein n=1 Tax=Agromyces agglutinans TaxID=2662258 RepID=A0A6I2FAA3_9MICO|nr:hypothetical protein [Agromyces agglutinans]MRG59670.1 hypothetical protein [Agromyces agglutinans]
MHILLIAMAFAIVLFRLLDSRPLSTMASVNLSFWTLPAIAGGATIGALLLVTSGSHATLALLGRIGLPAVDLRHRARANGFVWAAIGVLAVHFTAGAFQPLPGGPLLAAVLLGCGLGVGAARLHAASVEHEAYRTFNLVAMLLAAGALASMSLTPTGQWWTHNFSTLGTSDDLAAACFNLAIVMSGLAMAGLAPALSRALRQPRFGLRRGGLLAVRAGIVVIGVSLAGVGVVPIDGATDLHNLFACGAAAGFAALALGVRGFAKRMPRALVALSYAAVAVEVAALVAYDRLGLFNLTVFEVIAFSLVFAWLIALVATTHGRTHRAPVGSSHRPRWRGRLRRRAAASPGRFPGSPERVPARMPSPGRSRRRSARARPRRRIARARTADPRRSGPPAEEPPDAPRGRAGITAAETRCTT